MKNQAIASQAERATARTVLTPPAISPSNIQRLVSAVFCLVFLAVHPISWQVSHFYTSFKALPTGIF
jgi:hypothetical protein